MKIENMKFNAKRRQTASFCIGEVLGTRIPVGHTQSGYVHEGKSFSTQSGGLWFDVIITVKKAKKCTSDCRIITNKH